MRGPSGRAPGLPQSSASQHLLAPPALPKLVLRSAFNKGHLWVAFLNLKSPKLNPTYEHHTGDTGPGGDVKPESVLSPDSIPGANHHWGAVFSADS